MDETEGRDTAKTTVHEPKYVCRAGTAFLRTPYSENGIGAVNEIKKSLEADPRALWASFDTEQNPDFISTSWLYPDEDRTTPENLITGSDGFQVLRFDQPIIFQVSVPKKNQPRRHNADDIPTDTYWAAWNGAAILVLWKRESDHVPLSGGHVVFQVIEEVVKTRGFSVYNQACRPGCENIFLHTNLLLTPDPEVDKVEFSASDGHDISLRCGYWDNEKDLLVDLFIDLGGLYTSFSRQKNLARRIIDLESEAHSQLMHLLSHYAEHAENSAKSLWPGIKARWRGRGWRSEARFLSARIWLCLSAIEVIKRRWTEENTGFRSDLEEEELQKIFSIDYGDDASAVESIDLTRLDSLCSQVQSRLDNRALSWATAGGAVAGAITGSLASFLQ